MESRPDFYPTSGTFSSPFGYRKDPLTGRSKLHNGVDISNKVGTAIFAAGTGIVTYEPGAIQDMPLEMASSVEPLTGRSGQSPEAPAELQQAIAAQQAAVEKEAVKPETVAAIDGVVEFTARGPSWIQVRDASKKVVFERTLVKGEVTSVSGAPPLKVVVGRAEQVNVKVRGAQFDLASVAQSGVARFEVQ